MDSKQEKLVVFSLVEQPEGMKKHAPKCEYAKVKLINNIIKNNL